MTKIQEYYYLFVSEEESDFEGGLFLIEDKNQYDNDFIQVGLEYDQHSVLFSILDSVKIQQEQENCFTNYPNYTEEQFLKLFEGQTIKLIHKPEMW